FAVVARCVRYGLGQLGKARRVLAQLVQQGLGLGTHLLLVVLAGTIRESQQDVAGAPLLRSCQAGRVLIVVPAQFVLVERDVLGDGRAIQQHVFDVDLLGRLEQRGVVLVE